MVLLVRVLRLSLLLLSLLTALVRVMLKLQLFSAQTTQAIIAISGQWLARNNTIDIIRGNSITSTKLKNQSKRHKDLLECLDQRESFSD